MHIRDNLILKTWKVFATFGAVVGLLLLGLGLYYLWQYFAEPENSYRHEYLAGAGMAIMFSVPLWLLVSYSIHKNKISIPKIIYIPIIVITTIVCVSVVAIVLSPFYLS